MKKFNDFLTENLQNLSFLPPAVAKVLATWSIIGQNSEVRVINNATNETNVNKVVNDIIKEVGKGEYENIYVMFKYQFSRYDYTVRGDVTTVYWEVLSKDDTRQSTYRQAATVLDDGTYAYPRNSSYRGSKPDKLRLSDFNFETISKLSKIYVVFVDKNRTRLRAERANARAYTDPLARSTFGGGTNTSVNAEYARILFNKRLEETVQILHDKLSNISLITNNSRGESEFRISPLTTFVDKLKTVTTYGINFPYSREGKVDMKDLKEVFEKLEKLKNIT